MILNQGCQIPEHGHFNWDREDENCTRGLRQRNSARRRLHKCDRQRRGRKEFGELSI